MRTNYRRWNVHKCPQSEHRNIQPLQQMRTNYRRSNVHKCPQSEDGTFNFYKGWEQQTKDVFWDPENTTSSFVSFTQNQKTKALNNKLRHISPFCSSVLFHSAGDVCLFSNLCQGKERNNEKKKKNPEIVAIFILGRRPLWCVRWQPPPSIGERLKCRLLSVNNIHYLLPLLSCGLMSVMRER